MTEDRDSGRGPGSLKSADAVRNYQREWFAENRERVKQGEPFAICNGDDFEEAFNIMGIPVMCINYWHALVGQKQMGRYFDEVLVKHGYPVAGFARAMASIINNNPETSPWGGYPKPTIIVGGSKSDLEMKVLEYWARESNCAFYPLDWCLDSVPEWAYPPPDRWWERMRDHWDDMVEPRRLAARAEEEKALVNFVEMTSGKKLSKATLISGLELLNEQMEYWGKARDLIAQTVPCPVSMRDQGAMYQAMWHRGTTRGRDFIKAYYEEIKDRVEKGVAAVPNEQIRLSWSGDSAPFFSRYIEEKWGAAIVAWGYFSYPIDCYYRSIDYNDPMRTLAGHHMILFFQDPKLHLRDAKMAKCDGRIEVRGGDEAVDTVPSFKHVFQEGGMPICQLPRESDNHEVTAILDKFIEGLLANKKKPGARPD